MHTNTRILITGASGFLGWHLCREAAAMGHQVVALAHSRPLHCEAAVALRADLTGPDAISGVLKHAQPQAVIHAAADAQPNRCELDPVCSRVLNVEVTAALAEACGRRGLPMALISTDMVFDGQRAPYREDDPAAPVNVYGRQKLEAETLALQANPATAVCRLPLMFGTAPPGVGNFLQSLLAALQSGASVRLFTDEYRTPVDARLAAQGVLRALGRWRGRVHLGGPERISRYGFGQLLASVQHLNPDLIEPCLQADAPMPAPRPADVSLDSTLAMRELDYRPPPLAEQLRKCGPPGSGGETPNVRR